LVLMALVLLLMDMSDLLVLMALVLLLTGMSDQLAVSVIP